MATNARWASHVIVHAMTAPDAPNGKRSTCFMVPMAADGVSYVEMGGKRVWEQSSTGSIIFENVEVSETEILGRFGKGVAGTAPRIGAARRIVPGRGRRTTAAKRSWRFRTCPHSQLNGTQGRDR